MMTTTTPNSPDNENTNTKIKTKAQTKVQTKTRKPKAKPVEENTQEARPTSTAPSPVGAKPDDSKTKTYGKKVIGIGLGVFFIYAIISSGFTSKPKEEPTPTPQTTTSAITATAPKLALSAGEISKIGEALQNARDNVDDGQSAKMEKMRMVAPVQVYSAEGTGVNVGGAADTALPRSSGILGGDGVGGDINTRFMHSVSNSKAPTENASRILHPATTLAQGALVWATLETRITSDLPGMLRAVTSEDVYSEDGSNVLLPRGSRLIGQYGNAIMQGQKRVFVVWQRAIRPDHIDIQLNSPGTDQLGAAGIGADSIDYHLMEQFGTAAVISLIGAGAANVGVGSGDQYNSAAAYREAVANSFAQTAQNILQATGVIKPTIYINQGKKISVFVARDLDFYSQLNGAT